MSGQREVFIMVKRSCSGQRSCSQKKFIIALGYKAFDGIVSFSSNGYCLSWLLSCKAICPCMLKSWKGSQTAIHLSIIFIEEIRFLSSLGILSISIILALIP